MGLPRGGLPRNKCGAHKQARYPHWTICFTPRRFYSYLRVKSFQTMSMFQRQETQSLIKFTSRTPTIGHSPGFPLISWHTCISFIKSYKSTVIYIQRLEMNSSFQSKSTIIQRPWRGILKAKVSNISKIAIFYVHYPSFIICWILCDLCDISRWWYWRRD